MIRLDTGGGCLMAFVLFFVITFGGVYLITCIANGVCP